LTGLKIFLLLVCLPLLSSSTKMLCIWCALKDC